VTKSIPAVSVNKLARPLVERLIADAARLRVAVSKSACGAVIVDAGISAKGGIEAGRLIGEICLGGLGTVTLGPGSAELASPFSITVSSTDPVIACLGSQYAGWSLQEGSFFALGSGPARALWAGEELYKDLGYKDEAEPATIVVETGEVPPDALLARIAQDCGVAPQNLTVILTPTTTLAGSVQVVARSLEVALHKAHELGFALEHVIDGIATAPLPPPAGNFVMAMGRTNDAILYGGTVHLFVAGPDDAAKALADKLPSTASKDHGRPFADVFMEYGGDFYQIDPHLFSPGLVQVTAVESGASFRRGRLSPEILAKSFALDKS
jgi:methenyltetrahydromethanopterin cyclohydrolase